MTSACVHQFRVQRADGGLVCADLADSHGTLTAFPECPGEKRAEPYCPCGRVCHGTPHPCSLSCISHDERGIR